MGGYPPAGVPRVSGEKWNRWAVAMLWSETARAFTGAENKSGVASMVMFPELNGLSAQAAVDRRYRRHL